MSGQLIVNKGDNLPLPVNVVIEEQNGSQTPMDITGYTVLFTAKQRKTDSDDNAAIKATGTITNASEGLASINITPTMTSELKPGKYFYDIQLVSDDESNIITIINDILIVVQDITERTSDD